MLACPGPRTPRDEFPDDPTRLDRAKSLPQPTGPKGDRSYPVHAQVLATVFWVGEPATAENGCMPNFASAFDGDWIGAYGGCDAPESRTTEEDGFDRPAAFVPRENPFYFALPYGLNERAPWRAEIPWSDERADARSIRAALKNRWIGVRRGERTCYAQWEDVGPFCADDVGYVFGGAQPRNDGKHCDTDSTKGDGTRSGLDMSPALARCLGIDVKDSVPVDWWFVDDARAPEGPWRRVVTTSKVREGSPRPEGKCFSKRPYPTCG
jgi:hypothetical protein